MTNQITCYSIICNVYIHIYVGLCMPLACCLVPEPSQTQILVPRSSERYVNIGLPNKSISGIVNQAMHHLIERWNPKSSPGHLDHPLDA